ncbi:4'-phosphopantetheinyl transferase family protein [Naumannella huperziae]
MTSAVADAGRPSAEQRRRLSGPRSVGAASLFDRILPDAVVTAAATADDPTPEVSLGPGPEPGWLARAVPSRRAEFATTRRCAQRALSAFGLGHATVGRGSRGEPLWPEGFVGSLTHCHGYRAAAVARARSAAGIGIDVEPHSQLPTGVARLTASDAECRQLDRRCATDPQIHWRTVFFSAKEAIFKAWYPLTRCELRFREVVLSVAADGTFSGRILHPAADVMPTGDVISGTWLVMDELICTAVVVEPQSTAGSGVGPPPAIGPPVVSGRLSLSSDEPKSGPVAL